MASLDYDASRIHVLTGLEPVRRRPGMYIGGTDARALHHLVWECVGNVVDLHLAREATELHVEIRGPWVTVRDDGPGIPVHPIKPGGHSYLQEIFSTLRAGALRFPHVHVAPGLWGAGAPVVNALSTRLDVETTRDGIRYAQTFSRGEVATKLRKLGAARVEGTSLRFRPDPSIFSTITFERDLIRARLQELAWLYPHLRIFFQRERIHGRGGLAGWVQTLAKSTIADYAIVASVDGVWIDLALGWRRAKSTKIHSFVNTQPSIQGGTHVTGLWEGLAAIARERGHTTFYADDAERVFGPGLVGIIHVGLYQPQFGNPTKRQLVAPLAGAAVREVMTREFNQALAHSWPLNTFVNARLAQHRTTSR